MRRLIKVILPMGVLSFLIVVAAAFWSVQTLENAIKIEKEAIIIQDIVGDLSQQLQIAESSQRSFLLTGNEVYLRAYSQAVPKIPNIMKRLRRATAGIPDEEALVARAEVLVEKKLEEIKLTVVQQKLAKTEQTITITNADQGQQLLLEIFELLNKLDHKAELDAVRHEGFVKKYSVILKFLIGTGSLISLSMVMLFAGLSRREILQRKMNEESLQKAEQAALAASSLKSRLLSTISHEIRTPLNGIIGMSDLLRDRMQEGESRRYSDVIHQSSLALLRIVNDLLDFSKIEAGKIEFELSRLSCLDLVETAAELYSAKSSEKGITLLTYVDPAIPADLLGDSSRISQVLRNLIANAVKFTFTGGVIVRARHHFEAGSKVLVRFEIEDSGIGVTEDQRQHLFEAFHQLQNPSITKSEGTGLGLSICKGLVEQMGGTIGYLPSAQGSIFWFEIPLKLQSSEDRILVHKLNVPGLDHVFVFSKNSQLSDVLQLYAAEAGIKLTIQSELSPELTESRKESPAFTFLHADDYSDIENFDFLRRLFGQFNSNSKTELQIRPNVTVFTSHRLKDREQLREFPLTYLRLPFNRQRFQEILLGLTSQPTAQTIENIVPSYPHATAAFSGAADLYRGEDPEHDRNDERKNYVLLVEDNLTNQLVAESYLKKYGCTVHTVSDGEAALLALEKNTYKVVFMDCQMPVLDGIEATRRLRLMESQTGTHTPVIAMTANAMEADRQRCLAAGMDGFLPKPLQPIELEKVLLRWIRYDGNEFVDWAQLRKLASDTSSDVVKQLIQSYRATLNQSMTRFTNAAQTQDLDGIRRAAHHLRASSATLGANKLSELCKTLEFKAERTLHFEDVRDDLQNLYREAESVGTVFAEQKLFA